MVKWTSTDKVRKMYAKREVSSMRVRMIFTQELRREIKETIVSIQKARYWVL